VRYEFRSLTWTDKNTGSRRGAHLFRAGWDDTLKLLAREIEYLDGSEPVVIQVDAPEAMIRRDGMLHARARVGHPGVAISFTSRFGPLRYATDAYEDGYYTSKGLTGWQANVRAIALALEALRAVDRYGVTRRGEQYTGWKALPAAGNRPVFDTAQAAIRWMRDMRRDHGNYANGGGPKEDYRALVKLMHPDKGGDPGEWDKLDSARQVLSAAGVL
jgi:hypothetical protein